MECQSPLTAERFLQDRALDASGSCPRLLLGRGSRTAALGSLPGHSPLLPAAAHVLGGIDILWDPPNPQQGYCHRQDLQIAAATFITYLMCSNFHSRDLKEQPLHAAGKR